MGMLVVFLKAGKLNVPAMPSMPALPKIGVNKSTTNRAAPDIQYADPFITMSAIVTADKNAALLVDLRSEKDYANNRFKNSKNVFFPYVDDKEAENEFVNKVKELYKKQQNIVLLPYSTQSTSGERAYRLLQKAGLSRITLMKIGWNEMYSLPNLWIPEEKMPEMTLEKLLDN